MGNPTDAMIREAIDETRQLITDLHKLCCYDCGRAYCSDGWIEAVVDNESWKVLSPDGEGHGLLCIGCMATRAARIGWSQIPVKLTAGPFVTE